MSTINLGTRQLFLMKRENLSKKFNSFLENSDDASYVIQCAVAVLVRNSFTPSDFSNFEKDLIRDLFLTSDEVKSARKYCVYFRNYFSEDEWQTVVNRLFDSEEEFSQTTERTRLHIEKLLPMLHSGGWEAPIKRSLVTVFKDETGKKHGWTLSNVDRKYSTQENCDLLAILSTLTIFEKNGVRRFAELVKNSFTTIDIDYNSENEEEKIEVWTEQPKSAADNTGVHNPEEANLPRSSKDTHPAKHVDSSKEEKKREAVNETAATSVQKNEKKRQRKRPEDHQKKLYAKNPFHKQEETKKLTQPKKKKKRKKKRK
ncbi:hypothetical protein [Enterococcus sp. AZ163]|uniref:hypothetical protein n=1 Tax=Enterococcus sp. AZ163 TaxID=2774638 RepID=UPI003D27B912